MHEAAVENSSGGLRRKKKEKGRRQRLRREYWSRTRWAMARAWVFDEELRDVAVECEVLLIMKKDHVRGYV